MKNSAVSFFLFWELLTAGGPAHKLSIISSVTISTAAFFSSSSQEKGPRFLSRLSYFINGPKNSAWHFFGHSGGLRHQLLGFEP